MSGIVLGILALLGVMPAVLLSVAAVVYGSGLVLASMTATRVSHMGPQVPAVGQNPGNDAITFTGWLDLLAGLGAIVLGIVTLVMIPATAVPFTLVLVAFLALGCATFVSGTVVARKMMHLCQPVRPH